jgi:hypothetical protein
MNDEEAATTAVHGFEVLCRQAPIPPETLQIHRRSWRETFVGDAPAVLATDLDAIALEGGPQPD